MIPFQPQDFFSNDLHLVREIQDLEAAGRDSDVTLTLTVAGKVAAAARAPTVADIYIIPYTMQVRGQFSAVVQFLERVEHLAFITQVKALSINAVQQGEVNAVLTATFYIKK